MAEFGDMVAYNGKIGDSGLSASIGLSLDAKASTYVATWNAKFLCAHDGGWKRNFEGAVEGGELQGDHRCRVSGATIG